jgi:hypothetical protein
MVQISHAVFPQPSGGVDRRCSQDLRTIPAAGTLHPSRQGNSHCGTTLGIMPKLVIEMFDTIHEMRQAYLGM